MSDRTVSKSSLVFSAILDSQDSEDGWFTVSEIESGIEASRDTVERRVRDLEELGHLDSRTRSVGGLGESPTEYRITRADWEFEVGDFVDYYGDEVEVTGRIYNVDKEEYGYLILHYNARPGGHSVMEYTSKRNLE